MNRFAMPHVEINHKSVDLFFERLDPESRRNLYADLKAGHHIKAPNFGGEIINTVKEFWWDEMDIVDKTQVEKLVHVKGPVNPSLSYDRKTREYKRIHQERLAGYVKEELKPGYTGKFVIHSHKATHFHFDLRLSFPVTSVAESLGEYGKKRPAGKSPEPAAEKSEKAGTVLRSWAIPKHTLPTSKPLLATETEDHALTYGTFRGRIPEGEYGAGTVEIYDHGTFKLLDVEYDKKYVFEMNGKRAKGIYSLVKTSGKQFLWIKVKHTEKYKLSRIITNFRTASAIDYVQPTMSPQLWDLSTEPPKLKSIIRDTILKTFLDTCTNSGLLQSFRWVRGIFITGSSTGYNYKEDGDLDLDVLYDADKFRACYPALAKQDIFTLLKSAIYIANSKPVGNTTHTYSFMVLQEGDSPSADAIYDLLKDCWVKPPIKIPTTFDPDRAFLKERMFAQKISKDIDILMGRIVRLTDNLIKLNQYAEKYGQYNHRKIVLMASLRSLCARLDNYHTAINKMTEAAKNTDQPLYSAYPIGPNWDSRQVIFKYLARSGYHRPVHMLYERLNEEEKKIIDQFIPD